MKSQVVLAILVLPCWSSGAFAQVVEWANPAGGLWHEASNWSPPVVPDDPEVTARVGLKGRFSVVIDRDTAVGALEVLNDDATLVLENQSTLEHHDSILRNNGRIHLRGERFAELRFFVDTMLTGHGTLWVGDGGHHLPDHLLGGGPDLSLINGREHTIGGVWFARLRLINVGILQPRGQSDNQYGLSLEPSSRVEAEATRSLNGLWRLTASGGSVRVDGSLRVVAPDGYTPSDEDVIAVIGAGDSVTGSFATVDVPAIPDSLAYRWLRSEGSASWLTLHYSCLSDLSGSSDPNSLEYGFPDGQRDTDDFFTMLDFLATGDLRGDLTGSTDPGDPGYRVPDGVVDMRDFTVFLEAFGEECP